jgi:hypothetical protein
MAKNKLPSEGDAGSLTGYGKNFFAQPKNKPTKGKPPTLTTGGATTGTYGKVERNYLKAILKTPNPPDTSTGGGKVKVNQYGKTGTSKNK